MSDFLNSYVTVGLVGLLGVVLAAGGLLLGRVVRPKITHADRSTTYESGAEPTSGNWSQSHIRYYLYALLFVVFDVEIAFIIPWAVQVESFGGFGLIEMAVFITVLALGLVYAWRKGLFKWDS